MPTRSEIELLSDHVEFTEEKGGNKKQSGFMMDAWCDRKQNHFRRRPRSLLPSRAKTDRNNVGWKNTGKPFNYA
jgi:hypothetical protein